MSVNIPVSGVGVASASTIAETAVFFSIFTFFVMVLSVTSEYVMPFIISSLTLWPVFAESVKVSSLPLSTFPSAGRAGLTSILPFAGWVTVTLYFVFGVGLDGLGLGGFGFPCPGFSDGGLVKLGGGG